ncbi:MAG TPA: (2Fe-2S) ferredoxin domain-containing protein [Roseiflexaceae bacterium]|nr:(2Fe-2S) ferredoxin domain-containing protein [Roseiflexaceae bacterium]
MNEKRYRIYVCAGPNCTPAGRDAVWRAFELALWNHGLESDVDLRPSGCQSRCELGPNLTIWPGPVRYVGVTPALVERIVVEHLQNGVPVAELLAPPT